MDSSLVEDLAYRFRWQIALILVGLSLTAGGIFIGINQTEPELQFTEAEEKKALLVVEISGAVNKPGVYELESGSRVNDLLERAGGISEEANNEWVGKYLNKASYLADGQKIYIPSVNEQSNPASARNMGGYQSDSEVLSDSDSGLININTASLETLDSLEGIGPVYANKIIDNRPYSSLEELVTRKIITNKIYNENKEKLTVY